MKWRDDLPDDWDDAPNQPPAVDRPDAELVAVDGGAVFRPAEPPDRGDIETHSLFCDGLTVPGHDDAAVDGTDAADGDVAADGDADADGPEWWTRDDGEFAPDAWDWSTEDAD
ncbi:hypothetical protein [Halobaculum sp. D14]|uniref:hypothetical protein n=1 Tax=Halobaculum sp. D14 TaxID=3421642 RepID=UPI003EB76D49